jgi:hypothetical protein
LKQGMTKATVAGSECAGSVAIGGH